MNFHTKLDLLFKELALTNAQVAKTAAIDPSLISRFRTGKRIPSQNNVQILNLANSITYLAAEENKVAQLYETCGISPDISPKNLGEEICLWLCKTSSGLKKTRQRTIKAAQKSTPSRTKVPLEAFGEKLDALMNRFNVSNIRLARALNVDASLISRFRTGMRAPAADSWLLAEICSYFSARTKVTQQEDALFDFLKQYDENMIITNATNINEMLVYWLSKQDEPNDRLVMDQFLEKLDAFHPIRELPPHLLQSLSTLEPPHKSVEIFCGNEGLRSAVTQFLAQAAMRKDTHTLLLYSDQPITWLSENPEFAQIWMALMAAILFKGNRIRIIHNIDRSLAEMFSAIEKWMPLYMTGLIEPFYCEKSNSHRFHQTKFIVPDLFCIDAGFVAGSEACAEYTFYTDAQRVQYQEKQFNELLKFCSPLMHIVSIPTANACARTLDNINHRKGNLKILTPSLSIATLPKYLLESIMERNHLTEQEKASIRAYQESAANLFTQTLREDTITEMVAFPKDEDIFGGKVEVNLPRVVLPTPLTYTEKEYADHSQYVVKLLKENPKYRLCPLPMSPFQNIRIIIKENDAALLLKGDAPATSFLFEHPLMCRAFESYVDALNWQAPLYSYDKNAVIQQLLEYTK